MVKAVNHTVLLNYNSTSFLTVVDRLKHVCTVQRSCIRCTNDAVPTVDNVFVGPDE